MVYERLRSIRFCDAQLAMSGPAAGGLLTLTIEKTGDKYLISDPRGYGSQKREASLENGRLVEKGTTLSLERRGDKLVARLPDYPVGVFELTKP